MSCPVCHKKHHGLCHKCPHQADVAAGKYQDRPFNKTPCSGCRHAEEAPEDPSHQGQTFVSIEAAEFDRPIEIPTETRDTALADFLREFMMLTQREQIVIRCRFLHETRQERWTYERIGKRLKITPQTAHAIQLRVGRKIPAIGAMFNQEEGA